MCFRPTLVVIFSNALLILTLRQRHKFLSISAPSSPTSFNVSKKSETSGTVVEGGTLLERHSSIQMRIEHKVTLTVVAIVSSFIITQSPSAVVMLLTGFVENGGVGYHVHLMAVATFMIVIGKSLNFVLFWFDTVDTPIMSTLFTVCPAPTSACAFRKC